METRLVNKCADNIKCLNSEPQVNRRTEFTILGFVNKNASVISLDERLNKIRESFKATNIDCE